MAITSVSSISSLIGTKPKRRNFKLKKGGTIMPGKMRGKRKSSHKGKKGMTRGKKKKK